MIFRPELVEKVLYGEKTQTRRPAKFKPCRYAVGQTYAVQPGRGQAALGRIFVDAVRLVPLAPLSPRDAWAEGFARPEDFFAYWLGLYGDIDYAEPVYAISFHLDTGATSRPNRDPVSPSAESEGTDA